MTPDGPARPYEILSVEDNPGDVRLVHEAFQETQSSCALRTVRDGADAMRYLHRQDPWTSAAKPDLIILDLTLPKKDGCEVLPEIKAHPGLQRIPVVVVTTSDAPRDVTRADDCLRTAMSLSRQTWTNS
jgi:chemotaxis family two-component system response regulator Rcp1